jgi:hypothetical protein
MFPRRCSFGGCDKPLLAKGYCSAHYKQSRKRKPLRPLRPFYGRVRPYGPIGPCRFNDLPQVHSGEWEPCLATRSTGGWFAGHAAQWDEKRPLRPLRCRRTGCDFPGCSNRHSCHGYCAAHYRQLQRGKPQVPLNLRKGWYKASNGYIYIWEPDHPNSNKHGYVAEHTKVMASMLGRPLLPEEEVHHRNTQRDDNRPENLELWARGRQPPGARVSDLVERQCGFFVYMLLRSSRSQRGLLRQRLPCLGRLIPHKVLECSPSGGISPQTRRLSGRCITLACTRLERMQATAS